jgi:4-alpha-glucanotransferase
MDQDPDPGTPAPAGGVVGLLPEPDLVTLARLWDLQTGYRDVEGRQVRASRAALLAVLEALGAPVGGPGGEGVPEALRLRRRELWRRLIEPVVVAWDGRLASLTVRLPASAVPGRLGGRIEREDGIVETFDVTLGGAAVREAAEADGTAFVALEVPLRIRLTPGYHRIFAEAGGRRGEALVISAPRLASLGRLGTPEGRLAFGGEPTSGLAFGGETGGRAPRLGGGAPRLWGVFAPLYALHSGRSQGIGDLTDLRSLLEWIGGLGGHIVSTLPLLATFLDEPFEPSPYSPVSRRFWNEIYVDVRALPELEASPEARDALATCQRLVGAGAEKGDLVDYKLVAAAKRRVMEAATETLFGGASPRRSELEAFLASRPDLDDYATFRAAGEHFRAPWQHWPAEAREGRVDGGDAPERSRRYHCYVQYIAAGQLRALPQGGPAGLLLDLPLGVHPSGYDVWRERSAFVPGTSAGAPPDPLNLKGQDWGNPPLHPEGIRDGGYAYPISCIRTLMANSAVIRVDHAMGLHRIFVVPQGRDARDGVYVRYRPGENYAILCLESHRAGVMVVGEDLGTVPGYVRRAMAAHRVHRSYVAQFSVSAERGVERPTADAVAAMNTHDLPPYAAFWRGVDIEQRCELGLLSPEQARTEAQERARQRGQLLSALMAEGLLASTDASEGQVFDAWLAFLAKSDARAVLASLEDLWAETASQNLPGTVAEHPNWRRRMDLPLEAIRSTPDVLGRLELLQNLRTRADARPNALTSTANEEVRR